jgi:hypothetical protein
MDLDRFDAITRDLAAATSRRRVVQGATAAGVGVLLTLLARQTSEAANCPAHRQKCGPICCPRNHVCIPREQRCSPPGRSRTSQAAHP